jgi:hypothetical protein
LCQRAERPGRQAKSGGEEKAKYFSWTVNKAMMMTDI